MAQQWAAQRTKQALAARQALAAGQARGARQHLGSGRAEAPPEGTVRLVGALLALAIAAVHVADQGGVTALASPPWLGWGFRVIEAGGALTALALVARRPTWLGWSAGLLLSAGPFAGYLASRTVGVPGDAADVGNWGYWLGTVSLVIEAALLVLSLSALRTQRKSSPK